MTAVRRFSLLLVFVLAAGSARADLADYLLAINFDDVQAMYPDLDGAGQTIAVVDTGIDPGHIAFQLSGEPSRVLGGANFASDVPASGLSWSDPEGHGTMVASVAAGNPVSFAGVDLQTQGIARGATLYSARALDSSGSGGFAGILDALEHIRDLVLDTTVTGDVQRKPDATIRVVNMSLGTVATYMSAPAGSATTSFQSVVQQLNELGVAVVAASGNTGDPHGISFPAVIEEVIAVGSVDRDGNLSTFSNLGPLLDLVAPGEDLLAAASSTTRPGGETNVYYAGVDGTSFATPIVAGALTLVNQLHLQRTGRYPTVDEALGFLVDSAPVGTPYPRLDLFAALTAVNAIPEPATATLLALALLATPRPRRR